VQDELKEIESANDLENYSPKWEELISTPPPEEPEEGEGEEGEERQDETESDTPPH
jgi:hypothetical protein